ncbi:hypothetical protein [Acanthopleuribacter pedis]|nr:hypothetical protein [Acanthopleuribacter pedis]
MSGKLVYHGGLSAGRGHAEESSGTAAIKALAAGRHTLAKVPVYG